MNLYAVIQGDLKVALSDCKVKKEWSDNYGNQCHLGIGIYECAGSSFQMHRSALFAHQSKGGLLHIWLINAFRRKTETVFPPQNRWLMWKCDLVVELKAIRISTPISIAIVEDTSGDSSNMPLTLLNFLFPKVRNVYSCNQGCKSQVVF